MSDGSTVTITLEDGFSDLSDELTEERPLPADRFGTGELPAPFPLRCPEGGLQEPWWW